VIEEHPGRFAGLFVAQNFAAKRIGRVFLDPGDAQGRAVRDGGMTIRAGEEDGIVRRDFVEVGAGTSRSSRGR